jgi:hypothetical protein
MKIQFVLFGIADDNAGSKIISYVVNLSTRNPYYRKVLRFPYAWEVLEKEDHMNGWYPYNIKKL